MSNIFFLDILRRQFYFVVSGFEIISQGNPDNDIESLSVLYNYIVVQILTCFNAFTLIVTMTIGTLKVISEYIFN